MTRAAGSAREALVAATDALRAAGVEEARFDAEVLLEHATGWDRARMAAEPESEIPPGAARRFAEMLRRRLRREPVAYIVGGKWFRQIALAVDHRVLIPRPETELLVELALELRPGTVLDIGTGSGAVALAIAAELPGCRVTATDTSAAALEVARANAERLGLGDRVRFVEGTLPGDGKQGTGRDDEVAAGRPGFDLIVANLPYVAESDWDSLQPEVTEWEPREALLAGPDGLDAIRAVVPECTRLLSRPAPREGSTTGSARPAPREGSAADRGGRNLRPPGALALEVGGGQAEIVAGLLREAGFGAVESRRDLAGIERVLVGRQAVPGTDGVRRNGHDGTGRCR